MRMLVCRPSLDYPLHEVAVVLTIQLCQVDLCSADVTTRTALLQNRVVTRTDWLLGQL